MLRHNTCLLSASAALCSQDISTAAHRAEAIAPLPVHLKPSSSARRKPSFYFPRMREDAPPPYAFQPTRLGAALPLFSITSSSCEYYALRLPLLKAGFRRVPEGNYDIASNLIWGRSMPFREMLNAAVSPASGAAHSLHFPQPSSKELAVYLGKLTMVNRHQRFNHYPLSHVNLGCKRGMAANVRHAQQHAEAAAVTPGEREAARERYSFMPRTWFYPHEKADLVAAMQAAPSSSHFIWKPSRGSCGRGIMISDGGIRNTSSWEGVMTQIDTKAACKESGRLFRSYVVQEYIENPFLVEGRKMDLRLYVAVTSYNPLTVYWHEEGLVRLAAEAYTDSTRNGSDAALASDDSSIGGAVEVMESATAEARDIHRSSTTSGAAVKHLRDRFRHLTNYSVGRKYAAVQEAMAAARRGERSMSGVEAGEMLSIAGESGSSSSSSDATVAVEAQELKWPLQRLWDYIDVHGGSPHEGMLQRPSDRVRENIAQFITRTLMAVRPVIDSAVSRVPMPGHYFELYGFDVMLDTQLRPFLMEVNTLPSLESSSTFDYATKTNVIADLLNVAMLEPFEREVIPGSSLWNLEMVREELKQPLGAAEKPLVHSGADACGSEGAAKGIAASREDVQLRLSDEVAYARGFQRIFPAVQVSSVTPALMKKEGLSLLQVGHPLDFLGSTAAYNDDLRYYAGSNSLTQQDAWAHES